MPNPLIKWAQGNTHSDPPPPIPRGLQRWPQPLLLIAVLLDLIPLICQICHLVPSCSANRRPWWGAASLFFLCYGM